MSGIFQEHPNLRFVVAEGGWTWLPPFLWKLDQEWKAFRREVPWLKQTRPSSHMREHFRFTTQPFDAPATPEQLAHLVEQISAAKILMLSSDYPHDTRAPERGAPRRVLRRARRAGAPVERHGVVPPVGI